MCVSVFVFVCLFVGLFVGIKPEKLYSASFWEGSKPSGSCHTRAEAQNCDVHTKDSSTNHVLANLGLTLQFHARFSKHVCPIPFYLSSLAVPKFMPVFCLFIFQYSCQIFSHKSNFHSLFFDSFQICLSIFSIVPMCHAPFFLFVKVSFLFFRKSCTQSFSTFLCPEIGIKFYANLFMFHQISALFFHHIQKFRPVFYVHVVHKIWCFFPVVWQIGRTLWWSLSQF